MADGGRLCSHMDRLKDKMEELMGMVGTLTALTAKFGVLRKPREAGVAGIRAGLRPGGG